MQSQPGILDLSAYNLPKSETLPLRIQENFSLYGVRYTQLVVVAIAIGGLTNFAVLLTLFLSYLGWAYIMKQSSILDYLPDLGFVNTQDKKMILLLLFNILLILAISGPHILTYVGLGCLIVIVHASLWKSASTLPGQDIQQEFDKVLMQNDVELINH
ncbi:unnamed protein product [Paramecium sonneborni]|uniref:PRA1 family protein n=1 Tax=Paramecium sonneborni TaxID=65129 RepID=A0A8S1LHZ5_9CILI|nr:unnamed protein product [Paramecium sonneborni]